MLENPFNEQARVLPTRPGEQPMGGGNGPDMAMTTVGVLAKLLGLGVAISPALRNEILEILKAGAAGLSRVNPFGD